MTKTGASRCNLFQNLSLLVLLSCLGSALPADTHSLSCNIIVKTHTSPGQPWCEGQCSADEVPFIRYGNDNKATPLGDLGKEAHATQMWTDFVQELEYLGQELRKMLADTNLRKTKIRGHPTLQTIMLSQLEQGQIVGASLLFNISGKYSFTLNTMNMSWTPITLEAGGIMNKWTGDVELTKYLKISIANLSHWLKGLLKHHRERTRSTSRTPDASQHPSTSQFHNEKVSISLAAAIVIIFTVGILVKCCHRGDRNLQQPMNCSINCHKPQRKERRLEPSGEFPKQATKMLSQEDECQDIKRPEEDIGFPGTGVTDGCGYWELNPDPLQEQQVLLTTEPSLQPSNKFLKMNINA